MVTIRDFLSQGVTFEISNPVEHHRVVAHGGETDYSAAMLNLLRDDDVFYDIGACVGLLSLHAAKRCTVISFEPDPEFRARLVRNLSLNPGLSLEIHPVAVSDRDGTAILYTEGATGNSPSLRNQREEKRAVEVATRTLDSLVYEDGLPAPSVVKLDIEGAEILALRGATKLLRDRSTCRLLFLELHPAFLPAFDSSADEVLSLVSAAGFRPIYEVARAAQVHFIFERD